MKKIRQIIMVFIVAFLMLPNSGSFQAIKALESDETTVRLGGSNRIETAIKVSQQAYKGEAETVILVGSQGEVDALTGTILASINNAPILFTHKNNLSENTKAEILRLKAKNIIILGGDQVVSEDVVTS